MSLECSHLNPLQRDGTSQRQRLLEALKPDYIKVDEKEIQDWILYTRDYAKLIQFYNQQNLADGDWSIFIEKDISTLVAMVSRIDTQQYKTRFEAAVKKIEIAIAQKESSGPAFAEVLVILYEMAENLSRWYADAIPELGLHKALSRLITSRLDDAFAHLLHWLLKAETLELPLQDQGLPAINIKRRKNSWPNAQVSISLEAFPKDEIPDRKKESDREILHLNRLFKRFFEVMHSIVKQAPKFLEKTFTDYPEHQPHIALFLSFLNLMKVARDNMNSLTKRHLDFYYKDVLRLENRPEDPDEVHVIFELANNFENHKIKKDTQFDGGDDKEGEQLIYAADKEIIVNRAALNEENGLKSIFLHIPDPEQGALLNDSPVRNIYAAPKAHKISPEGDENKGEYEKWLLFGNEKMPFGEVGFALASPMFLLHEGQRKITASFRFRNLQDTLNQYGRSRIKSELKNNVKIYLTGEEGWVEVRDREVTIKTDGLRTLSSEDDLQNVGELVWVLNIPTEEQALVRYSEEIHQRNLDTDQALALFILDNEGLSTLGNLELNLAGKIAPHEGSATYLKDEIVKVSSEDNLKSYKIFKSRAEVIISSPGEKEDIWKYLKDGINKVGEFEYVSPEDKITGLPEGTVIEKNYEKGEGVNSLDEETTLLCGGIVKTIKYNIGDVVYLSDEENNKSYFRANAPIETGFQIPPGKINTTEGLEEAKIWELVPTNIQLFDITRGYPQGALVIDANNDVYEARQEIIAQIPPNLGDFFNELNIYNSHPINKKYKVSDLVKDPKNNGYFWVTEENFSGFSPDSDSADNPWIPIEGYEDKTYVKGNEVVYGAEIFIAEKTLSGVPPQTSWEDFWEVLPLKTYEDTDVNPFEAQKGDFVLFDDKIYRPLPGLDSGSFFSVTPEDSIGVEKLINSETADLFVEKPQNPKGKIYYGTSNKAKTRLVYKDHEDGKRFFYQCNIDLIWGLDPEIEEDKDERDAWIKIPEHSDKVNTEGVDGENTRTYGTLARVWILEGTVKQVYKNISGGDLEPTVIPGSKDAEGKWAKEKAVDFDNTLKTLYEIDAIVKETEEFYIAVADNQGARPSENKKIWTNIPDLEGIDTTSQDNLGKLFVKTGNSNTQVFTLLKNFKGIPLDYKGDLWKQIDSYQECKDNDISYKNGAIVAEGKKAYKAIWEKSFCGIKPEDNSELWKPSSDTIPLHDYEKSYDKDQKVKVNVEDLKFYRAKEKFFGFGKSKAGNWEKIPDLDTSFEVFTGKKDDFSAGARIKFGESYYLAIDNGGEQYSYDSKFPDKSKEWRFSSSGLEEYDSKKDYCTNQYVRSQGLVFKSNAIVKGISPALGLLLWDVIDVENIERFNPEKAYRRGEYIIDSEDRVFITHAGGKLEAPFLVEDSENPWERIPNFQYYLKANPDPKSGENPPPILVVLGGRVYSTDKIISRKPGPQSHTEWKEIKNIPCFEAGIDYQKEPDKELIVFFEGFFYRLKSPFTASGKIEPQKSSKIWEEITEISNFRGIESYVPGEYVEFEDKIYRPLVELIGDDPAEAPELWQEVGIIREFVSGRSYEVGFHVQVENPKTGQDEIYRALRNTNGSSPLAAIDQHFWELVPGAYPYNYFLRPELEKLYLDVDVSGMKNPILENDDGPIKVGKPFDPFGSNPKVGSRFYIGSPEIFQKSLTKINLELQWGNIPINNEDPPKLDFIGHYENYNHCLTGSFKFEKKETNEDAKSDSKQEQNLVGNEHFTGSFEFLQNGRWQGGEILKGSLTQSLFENGTANSDKTFLKTYELVFIEGSFKRDPKLGDFEEFRNGMPKGFMRLSLQQDFLHELYPVCLTKAAINEAKESPNTEIKFPNEPYTPLINDLTLSYGASEIISYKSKGLTDMENRVEKFFHIYPFGQKEIFPIKAENETGPLSSLQLVPRFFGKKEIGLEAELGESLAAGSFYMGLNNLSLPQNLEVLFQVAEGSENTDRERQVITWSYLSHDRWIDFTQSEILSDTSNGLLTSGIISFSLPKEMTNDNTTFPRGIYWIKASIVDYPDAVSNAIAVIPQAVQASFRKQPENDLLHLKNPLKAETISELIKREAGISSVAQPFASFGGRLQEQDEEFYIRVAERLRHKSRGITIYDYERLVLQEFPQVYKAKCLNHTWKGNEHHAGKVNMVVVSDLRNENAPNKLRPTLSVNSRDEIQKYLKKKSSNFAEIQVINPLFEEVQVKCKVEFLKGKDKNFYIQQLQKDIVRFMAPWLYDENAELVFGNKMSSSALINFIDEQNYVDFLADLVLCHRVNEKDKFLPVKGDEVISATSASVLVPAPEREHLITPNITVKC